VAAIVQRCPRLVDTLRERFDPRPIVGGSRWVVNDLHREGRLARDYRAGDRVSDLAGEWGLDLRAAYLELERAQREVRQALEDVLYPATGTEAREPMAATAAFTPGGPALRGAAPRARPSCRSRSG